MPSLMQPASQDGAREESALPFFHGAMLDQDVDGQLKNEGDFLLQLKPSGKDKTKLILAVKGRSKIKCFEVQKTDSGQFKLAGGKAFDSVKELVDYYQTEAIEKGYLLKKAVPRGKFQMYHADVRILKKIGSGAYGTVYRGLSRRNDQVIAIKRIDSEGADEQALAEMMKEARVMQLYDHRNIVRFFGFIVDRKPYLLVMEYCDGGAVEDKLRSQSKGKLPIATRVDWCAQAAAGLEYLHSKECIHRDLASRNCLLNRGIVKLADFGMCRPTSVYKVDVTKPMNVRWLAPEVWKSAETRYNTDIFAFAVMLWEMFEIPYATPYSEWKAITVKNKTMEGYRLHPPELMPEDVAEIMEKAWHHDPAKRPDARKLRKMLDEANSHAQTQKGGGNSSREKE